MSAKSFSSRKRFGGSLVLAFLVGLLVACSTNQFVLVKSENVDERVKYVVLHYTSENFEDSLRLLTKRSSFPVSAHYLIPEREDATYPRSELRIYQLVEEEDRAWHAGRSSWLGQKDLNNTSIGIELVNLSGCSKSVESLGNSRDFYTSCDFREFDSDQVQLLIELLRGLLKRYPNIKPINIVGHSDIAPNRKIDPGPKFPWRKLYEEGFGIWYEKSDYEYFIREFAAFPPSTLEVQKKLSELGYGIDVSGEEDLGSQLAVRAFQMRFLNRSYSGFLDTETVAIIYALHMKYL